MNNEALNEGAIYKQGSTIVNLASHRLNNPQRGLNIIKGKKILLFDRD